MNIFVVMCEMIEVLYNMICELFDVYRVNL